ncbi:MAG TPA: LamG domain-containing protein, partial [Anaerolineales bacterium]
MSSNRVFQVFVFAFLLVSLSVGLELPPAQAAPQSITMGVCEADPDLVGCWQMDNGSGSIATNGGAIPANYATINTPRWVTGHGSSGYALSMNGLSGYAYVQDEASLDIQGAITLSAWVKPAEVATKPIISKANPGGTYGNGYELTLSGPSDLSGSQRVFFRINAGTEGDNFRVNSTSTYPITGDTWVHVAGVYDGSTMKLYYNNLEPVTLDRTVTIGKNSLFLGIGSDGVTSTSRLFKGTIDDVRVYKRALSASEIGQLAGIATAVNLASFTGSTLGNIVHLTWTTA